MPSDPGGAAADRAARQWSRRFCPPRSAPVSAAARTSMGFQFRALASVAPPLVEDPGLGYAEVGSLNGGSGDGTG